MSIHSIEQLVTPPSRSTFAFSLPTRTSFSEWLKYVEREKPELVVTTPLGGYTATLQVHQRVPANASRACFECIVLEVGAGSRCPMARDYSVIGSSVVIVWEHTGKLTLEPFYVRSISMYTMQRTMIVPCLLVSTRAKGAMLEP